MRIRLEIDLPTLPRRGARRAAIALVMAVAVAVPGLALASHQYSDVLTGHPFHGDIAAISDAGVTSGCGNGEYCPDRAVTRAEMAAFMNRLGALAPNKTPVVNAAKVDGFEGTDLAFGTATIPSGMTVTGYQYVFDAGLINDAYGGAFVPLPARAPVPLQAGYVNFAPSANANDDDANCTGSVSTPTAPADRVCIYLDGYAYADNASGSTTAAAGYAFADRGFIVTYQANNPTAGNQVGISFSWAYTAP